MAKYVVGLISVIVLAIFGVAMFYLKDLYAIGSSGYICTCIAGMSALTATIIVGSILLVCLFLDKEL